MVDWKRPLGFEALVGVVIIAGGMTAALASMVWSRVSLLHHGTEVLLKTAPVDPRDLLRGYYVQLAYDIANIRIDKLPHAGRRMVNDAFSRSDTIFVRLRPGSDGFWAPVSLHLEMPSAEPGSAVIRGRVQGNSCVSAPDRQTAGCSIQVVYGIEKFFTNQQRAQELEKLQQDAPAVRIEELRDQLKVLQEQRQTLPPAARERDKRAAQMELERALERQIAGIERQIADLVTARSNGEMLLSERFAVVVRLSSVNGASAIAGLRLDGQTIYEESLF